MMAHPRRVFFTSFVAVGLAASFAAAEGISFSIVGFVPGTDPAEGQVRSVEKIDLDEEGRFFFETPEEGPEGELWQLNSLTVVGQTNPLANLNFAVTNTTTQDIEFNLFVTVPIPPIAPETLYGGSAAFTLTDNTDSSPGATLSSNLAGDPLYAGQIDGSTVLPLLDAPFLLSIPSGSSIAGDSLSFPLPTIDGPAASSIGIELNFVLSPGDSASGTTVFNVEPDLTPDGVVPEPSAALLATAGALLALRRGRRG